MPNLLPAIGSHHPRAFVGPPEEYDLMGATQFRLLTALGLRSNHRLLDFGCGSLRAGRLLIPYLDPDCYFGVEPNDWLIEEARAELGNDLFDLKRPTFDHNSDFVVPFEERFDFVVAQSIASHTGPDLTRKLLANLRGALMSDGLLLVTFFEGDTDNPREGWIYPDCCAYRKETAMQFLRDSDLSAVRLPWFHPRQTWYAAARSPSRLPAPWQQRYLTGAVFGVPTWDVRERLLWRSLQKMAGRVARAIGAR
jgi:SAM-dependent methyltransferase